MSRFETKVLHAGIEPDPVAGAVMTPIYQTSTYAQKSPGEHQGYEYSRTDNPTRTVLQTQLAALESADRALVFASGLASIDAVLNLLKVGDHIVAGDDLYGGTFRLFNRVAKNRGLEFTFVDMRDHAAVRESMRPNTKLVWVETPTNPGMVLVDIAAIATIAHEGNALLAVDNTFMSPYNQRPLELGADIVMHSMTKWLNGHSDVVMGALMIKEPGFPLGDRYVGENGLGDRLKFLQNSIGAVPGPHDCFLVLRGIKTLAVRMQRHNENGLKIAKWLQSHPRVESVRHPGLTTDPGHELAKRQMHGFGGMITFFLKSDLEGARRFLESLELFTLAESLGGVESLVDHPAIMTHASVPLETRLKIGLTDNLVRLSVGIEHAEDLMADLDRAINCV